jgi:hypothetical protein
MVIGDRRFAAQLRERGGSLRRFDDLGCALTWLDDHPEVEAAGVSIFVRACDADRWLAAETARFASGFDTPMGYGVGACAADGEAPLALAEVRALVREREDARRSGR